MYDELWNMEKEEDLDIWNSINQLKGKIEFRNLEFSYTPDKKVINKINMQVSPGQKVAIVGDTGSWKSTIVNLLLRFWELNKGEILIDDININEIKKSSLRHHIWVVSQDNSLFNLSIEENLKFAKPNATTKELEQALKNAEAHFIFDLKKGIKTVDDSNFLVERNNVSRLHVFFLKTLKYLYSMKRQVR
jgi:ATP-binding cassette subfamily B protein